MEPPYFSRSKPPCRLSDPAHPHNLCRWRQPSHPPLSICFSCKGKHLKGSTYYYYCASCNLEFHRGCHIILPELRHPFHLSHPLTYTFLCPEFNLSRIPNRWESGSSSSEESTDEVDDDYDDDDDSDDDDYVDDGNNADDDVDSDDDDNNADDDVDSDDDDNNADDDVDSDDDANNHGRCKCCWDPLEKAYYHCSICKFNLNLICSMRLAPPTILHLKSHDHKLTLFPIPGVALPCGACGFSLRKPNNLVYTCLPCSHIIHRSCIYLPRVIKITRHPHRISLISSLFPGPFPCGVCRNTVNVNYGRYSCDKGCHYAVHSKCATREEVWDGIDLEGVPEEPEEDIKPFVRIDEETIQHFSHEHNLKLHVQKNICEKDKFCEACTIPIIISQRFYCCMQCDFVLDEACASLPLKSYNPLHKHPLTLHPSPIGEVSMFEDIYTSIKDMFKCDGCHRLGCGFLYKCDEKDCGFRLDVRCASLPDPLIHGCHPHDLFFNLTRGKCMGCGSYECSAYYLECIKCKFFLGIRCATLPPEAHYKHDRHPLTLCFGEEDTTRGQYWCEICESKVDQKTWFYTCDRCRITLHVNCLLGQDIYMKPRHIFKMIHPDREIEIAHYDGNSRLLCSTCNIRCAHTLVFNRIGGCQIDCSLKCAGEFLLQKKPPKYMYPRGGWM